MAVWSYGGVVVWWYGGIGGIGGIGGMVLWPYGRMARLVLYLYCSHTSFVAEPTGSSQKNIKGCRHFLF